LSNTQQTLAAAFIASPVGWLLQWRSIQRIFPIDPSTSVGPEHCRPSGRRCSQIRTHHAGPSRRASLAAIVPQRIQFKIAVSAFDCVREHCPAYFDNVCILVAGISGRANLYSAERHDMLVPSTRTQLGRWSFCVAALAIWSASPSQLRSSSISREQFRAGLKMNSLELGWKLISSRRRTDTSENFCWRAYYFIFTLHFTWDMNGYERRVVVQADAGSAVDRLDGYYQWAAVADKSSDVARRCQSRWCHRSVVGLLDRTADILTRCNTISHCHVFICRCTVGIMKIKITTAAWWWWWRCTMQLLLSSVSYSMPSHKTMSLSVWRAQNM